MEHEEIQPGEVLYELLEKDIIDARDKLLSIGEASPNLQNALDIGEKLRDLGLTPLYATTADMRGIIVTSSEKVNKKFH